MTAKNAAKKLLVVGMALNVASFVLQQAKANGPGWASALLGWPSACTIVGVGCLIMAACLMATREPR